MNHDTGGLVQNEVDMMGTGTQPRLNQDDLKTLHLGVQNWGMMGLLNGYIYLRQLSDKF